MAKLVMPDKQMAMLPSIFSKVMLRQSKLAIAALKEIYKDEAQHVAHDITARSPMTSPLGCVRLQSLPTPSLWTMSLFSHPGTSKRNRTSRAFSVERGHPECT